MVEFIFQRNNTIPIDITLKEKFHEKCFVVFLFNSGCVLIVFVVQMSFALRSAITYTYIKIPYNYIYAHVSQ